MARTPYATDGFQERMFVAPSFDALVVRTKEWLERRIAESTQLVRSAPERE